MAANKPFLPQVALGHGALSKQEKHNQRERWLSVRAWALDVGMWLARTSMAIEKCQRTIQQVTKYGGSIPVIPAIWEEAEAGGLESMTCKGWSENTCRS